MTQIELADAQLAAVVVDGGTVTLRFPVAPARQAGEGADARPVNGYLQGVRITLSDAKLTLGEGNALGECIGAVREGRLVLDGQPVRPLTAPGVWSGDATLRLSLANGARLRIAASLVQLSGVGGFRESFAC